MHRLTELMPIFDSYVRNARRDDITRYVQLSENKRCRIRLKAQLVEIDAGAWEFRAGEHPVWPPKTQFTTLVIGEERLNHRAHWHSTGRGIRIDSSKLIEFIGAFKRVLREKGEIGVNIQESIYGTKYPRKVISVRFDEASDSIELDGCGSRYLSLPREMVEAFIGVIEAIMAQAGG